MEIRKRNIRIWNINPAYGQCSRTISQMSNANRSCRLPSICVRWCTCCVPTRLFACAFCAGRCTTESKGEFESPNVGMRLFPMCRRTRTTAIGRMGREGTVLVLSFRAQVILQQSLTINPREVDPVLGFVGLATGQPLERRDLLLCPVASRARSMSVREGWGPYDVKYVLGRHSTHGGTSGEMQKAASIRARAAMAST